MNYSIQKLSVFLFCCFIIFSKVDAQFVLNGSAIVISDDCYQLTSTNNWEVGSIWNEEKIDLTESFEVVVELFLGCKDAEGADGLVFGLQPVSTSIGTGGGDLGFGEVMPALGVEFDTYQNIDYEDPTYDHITVLRDGNVRHNTPGGSLAGPVQANIDNPNIEDCMYHAMQINWDAETQTLSVYFDCELRLTYEEDIVTEIFSGDPLVYWGFTSATGGLNNKHEVCFNYTTFLNDLVDQTICPGTSAQLEASGGVAYAWSPATGLSDTTIANPIATPTETTLYTVEIIDDCGIPFYSDVLITVQNDAFEVDIASTPDNTEALSPGTELSLDVTVTPSDNETYTYEWAAEYGSSFENPNVSNTTAMLSVNELGMEVISVEVVAENGCIGRDTIVFDLEGAFYDIPSIFSPNGDGIDDDFGIITEAQLEKYQCKIYNRWGQLVFETTDSSQNWNGLINNKPAPSGVYLYLITLEVASNNFEEMGDLTLLR